VFLHEPRECLQSPCEPLLTLSIRDLHDLAIAGPRRVQSAA
jgi:hypothetical protein